MKSLCDICEHNQLTCNDETDCPKESDVMSIKKVIKLINHGCRLNDACQAATTNHHNYQQLHKKCAELGLMSRTEAAAAGLPQFNLGTPCSKGHDSPRYTSTGMCIKCREEYNKEYQKQLKKERAGKVRVILWLDPEDVKTIKETAAVLTASGKTVAMEEK